MSRSTALVVVNKAGLWLDEKVPGFMAALVAAARNTDRPLVADRGLRRVNVAEAEGAAATRPLGAGHVLVVSIDDFASEVDSLHGGDLLHLHVDVTLCASSLRVECGTGRVVEARTFALCRRTTPIVVGTAVGGRVLDALLTDIAAQIVGQRAASRSAA